MITKLLKTFYQVLILALITQAFAGVLPHRPQRRHLSRRAIEDATRSFESATSDRDIAMVSLTDRSDQSIRIGADQVGLISKPAEGESDKANASTIATAGSESENNQSVKSTKLILALGSNDANTGDHKPSEKVVLNRVKSPEVENSKEVVKENVTKVKEGTADVFTEHHTSSEVTNMSAGTRKLSKEVQALNTARVDSVFSQANEWSSNSMPTVNLEKHINNGLDEITLRKNEKTKANADSNQENIEQPATTEEILKDLEDLAVKLGSPRTEDVSRMQEKLSESGHVVVGLEESKGRSMDAAYSSENKLEITVGKKPKSDEIPATTNPILEKEKNVEGGTMVSEQGSANVVNSFKPPTEAEIIENPKKGNSEVETEFLSTIKMQPVVTNETETNSHINNISSTEKHAKFFNENIPSSQLKMNLPDGPEIWSLASMRTVPKIQNINSTPLLDNKSAELRWQGKEILTTERTVNVSDYSEKNLLDWTKVMEMRSELESEDTVEKNLLTGNALEEDKVDSVKSPKTELSLQMDEISKIDPSIKINTTAGHSTEGFAASNARHEFSATQTMNEIDNTQIAMKTTAMPTITTNPPTEEIQQFSKDSFLSVDNSDKHANLTSTTTAGTRERLNGFYATPTETLTLQLNAEKVRVEKINAAENTTQQQPSEDLYIITSTTPLALLDVTAGVAREMSLSNETTPAPAAPTMLTALPVEQSTSTTTTPPPRDVSEAPTRWDNATALEPQPEATLLNSVDSDNSNAKVQSDVSGSNGMHSVTLEQQLKREPETVTEIAIATEERATLLTVSERPTSEANGPISAGDRQLYVNVNVSAETGEGIATQNETQSVATEITTESNHITETATITFINTTILPTDLVKTYTTPKTSQVLGFITIATTTDVSQIDNEVELEVRTENITDATEGLTDATTTKTVNSDTGSSTNKKQEHTVTNFNEPNTTAKTVPSINELLVPVNKTTDITTSSPSTTELPITTPPTQFAVEPVLYTTTTLKSVENVNAETTTTIIPLEITTVQASGSVLENSTTTNNTLTPVDFRNHTTVAKGVHDTENSIETNVIDQLDKTTVKITSTTAFVPTTSNYLAVAEVDGGEKSSTEASYVVSVFGVSNETTLPSELGGETARATNISTTTSSTTMAAIATTSDGTPVPQSSEVNHTSSDNKTTEPPLINLLDESTTAPTTKATSMFNQLTTTSSIAVNPQEVYTVFSTTEKSDSTSTAAITPLAPIITTTSSSHPSVESSTYAFIPKVASTIATLTTTMLPPTLHAAIGSSGGSPSHIPGMINAGMRPNSSDNNETDVNVIIAITVSIIGVVALILLVAFLYLMRKRQKQMSYGQRCRPVSLDAYSLDNVSVLGSVRRKGALRASKRSYGNIAFDDPSLRHNALSASELSKFVERRSSIFEEFRDVPQIIARADEVPAGCEDKNRYANVIPLPETRVVLQQLGDDDKTEYINANYVRGPKDSPNYYIATQAPLETTVADFWRMIWEQQSRVIIQATDLYENGIEKCAEYLPPSVTLDNHTTYGDFQITLKHREVKDKYAISTLMLKNTAEDISRELTHYWYKWPETGVPNEEAPIIAMLLEARSSLKGYVNELREKNSNATLKTDHNSQDDVIHKSNGSTVIKVDDDAADKLGTEHVNSEGKENGDVEINGNVSGMDKMKGTTLKNQGPLTIHCSPGTGRTGTIIACDMAIRSLETPKRSVDIPQIVYYVRRGRASAVQTKEQYEFIYKAAHMYATKITNLSNEN